MDLPIVLSHKTAWLYHNVARPSEPLSRASSLYDEDSLAKRSQGGLGYAKIELNHRVDVPNEFRYLAKAGYFEIDVYAPASGTGIEYNGSDHLDKQRGASDAERMTVLSALGFRMVVLTGTQFAHQLQLHRATNAIALAMGLKCDRSEAFQKRQNDLREFVIRHWGGGL